MRPARLLALAIALAPCCVGESGTPRRAVPPARTSEASSHLLVISAVYGSGTRFADVTCRVSDLLHQPDVEFFARPEWLRADPTPGWNKALVIVFEFEDRRHLFTTGEGGKVSVDALLSSLSSK
jgi:hypothetical protein